VDKIDIATAAQRAKARAACIRDTEARVLALELDRLPTEDLGDTEYMTRAVTLTLRLQARTESVN